MGFIAEVMTGSSFTVALPMVTDSRVHGTNKSPAFAAAAALMLGEDIVNDEQPHTILRGTVA